MTSGIVARHLVTLRKPHGPGQKVGKAGPTDKVLLLCWVAKLCLVVETHNTQASLQELEKSISFACLKLHVLYLWGT